MAKRISARQQYEDYEPDKVIEVTKRLFIKSYKLVPEDVLENSNIHDKNIVYDPKPDLAIGPFHIKDDHKYQKMINDSYQIIERFIKYHNQNILKKYPTIKPVDIDTLCEVNNASNCLFWVEFDNTGSRKHILGSMINASMFGKIGIVVGFNNEEDNFHELHLKFYQYIEQKVKTRSISRFHHNIIILKPVQIITSLRII